MLQAVQETLQIDVDEPIEDVVVGVDDQARGFGAGVVDRAVEPSVGLTAVSTTSFTADVVGDVRLDEGHRTAGALDGLGSGATLVCIRVAADDFRALRRERLGQHTPAPSRRR